MASYRIEEYTRSEGIELVSHKDGSTLRISRGRRPLDFSKCLLLMVLVEILPSDFTSTTFLLALSTTVLYNHLSSVIMSPSLDSAGSETSYSLYDDPLYMTSNDQPHLQLVTPAFDGNHFLTWKRDALMALAECSCGAMDSCSCQFLKRLLDRDTQAKTIQLLMGLNHSFEQVKEHILELEPMPPMPKILGYLQRAEKQKQLSDSIDTLAEGSAYTSYKTPLKVSSEQSWKKPKSGRDEDLCSHCQKQRRQIIQRGSSLSQEKCK